MTRVTSLVVGLQQAGALFGALACAPLTDRIGRKYAIQLSCLVFIIGAILEIIPSHSLDLFYAARVIAGVGLGSMYTIVPMYSAEMAPKEIRGRLGGCLQWMFTWGVLTSYWVDYGVKKGLSPIPAQWQIPLGLQMVPAGILGLGLFTQKESIRWLVKKGREEDAWKALSWLRADDSPRVRAEFEEIVQGIHHESHVMEGFKVRELWEPANRTRVFIAFNICAAQQFTGATALAYFGPQFFKLITGPGDRNLLITALFGVIKVIACGIFIVFFSERFGRKKVLMGGAIGMGTCMIITSVLVKVKPPPGGGQVTGAGVATVALIFLNIAIYNFSWGPVPYPYMAEIFPSRIRASGVSVGMGAQWLFNFMFSLVTPYMIQSMGWGTFLFFAACDIVMATWVFFVLKETRGKSIEEMEHLFHSGAGLDMAGVEKAVGHEAEFVDKDGHTRTVHVEGDHERTK